MKEFAAYFVVVLVFTFQSIIVERVEGVTSDDDYPFKGDGLMKRLTTNRIDALQKSTNSDSTSDVDYQARSDDNSANAEDQVLSDFELYDQLDLLNYDAPINIGSHAESFGNQSNVLKSNNMEDDRDRKPAAKRARCDEGERILHIQPKDIVFSKRKRDGDKAFKLFESKAKEHVMKFVSSPDARKDIVNSLQNEFEREGYRFLVCDKHSNEYHVIRENELRRKIQKYFHNAMRKYSNSQSVNRK
jgi:hypothetical protein